LTRAVGLGCGRPPLCGSQMPKLQLSRFAARMPSSLPTDEEESAAMLSIRVSPVQRRKKRHGKSSKPEPHLLCAAHPLNFLRWVGYYETG
jgi:hypothetical protein